MTRTTPSRNTPRAPRRRGSGVLRAVRPIVEAAARTHDLTLWDVDFAREAGTDVLRVAVDRRGGVDSDAVASLAETLSREIDAADAVPGDLRYLLEVTSPGAERRLHTLEQFAVCVGRPARLTFKSGREPLVGEIVAADDEAVQIRPPQGEDVRVPLRDVSQARLHVPPPQQPKRAPSRGRTGPGA